MDNPNLPRQSLITTASESFREQRKKMEKTFEFIDSRKNDKLTRKLARSHAMKGKNTGKKLNRRSRLELGQLHRCRPNVLLPMAENRKKQLITDYRAHCSLQLAYNSLSNDLLSVSFPLNATPQSQRVINQCKCFEACMNSCSQ